MVAGLLEQNRLSGANRNALIAGGIMANTAEIFNFPVPDVRHKNVPRVANLDDGYTRIANEFAGSCDAGRINTAPASGLLAVMRKTYGFNKNGLGETTGNCPSWPGYFTTKCSAAKVFW